MRAAGGEHAPRCQAGALFVSGHHISMLGLSSDFWWVIKRLFWLNMSVFFRLSRCLSYSPAVPAAHTHFLLLWSNTQMLIIPLRDVWTYRSQLIRPKEISCMGLITPPVPQPMEEWGADNREHETVTTPMSRYGQSFSLDSHDSPYSGLIPETQPTSGDF